MKNLFLLIIATVYVGLVVYFQSIQRLPAWSIYWLIGVNVLSFICYGIDKLAAIKQWQRTPEKHFYIFALFSGWPGSVIGQLIFNHKTTKVSFRRWFYSMVIFNISAVLMYLFGSQTIILLA